MGHGSNCRRAGIRLFEGRSRPSTEAVSPLQRQTSPIERISFKCPSTTGTATAAKPYVSWVLPPAIPPGRSTARFRDVRKSLRY